MKQATSVTVTSPTFEHSHSGFGIQLSRPRISWRFCCEDEAVHDWTQVAYDIEIRSDGEEDSTCVHADSCSSNLVSWPEVCSSLTSRERRHIRVRCFGNFKINEEILCETTAWSPWSSVEAALLENGDWSAQMITAARRISLNDDGSARPLCFWKHFTLPQGTGVKRARLYATSHGVYEASINSRQVGEHSMAPGWQSYHARLHYQVYDVTNLLKTNAGNLIEIHVGPGWFASALTWAMRRFNYGRELGVLAQLEITLDSQQRPIAVATNDGWLCSNSNVVSSEIYAGELFDTRPSSVSMRWKYKTKASTTDLPPLISPVAPPVRIIQRLKPQKIFLSKSGLPILDFGQNIAGRICIQEVRKPAGYQIIFRHAEVMEDRELGTRQLRGARATDILLCNGKTIHNWHPRFTFHGFRYVEVQEWSPKDAETPLTLDSIDAEVMHCDMRRTAWFRCSNEEVNRLHENALWSVRSNFLSVPTDDPQRDERLGWTGDLNIICPTASLLYNTTSVLSNWLEDLLADQMDSGPDWRPGVVPLVVPNCIKKKGDDKLDWESGWDPMPNGVWADAAVMVPWQLYLFSGDNRILSRQYRSMQAYLEHGVARGPDGLWNPEVWQFGDWLDPSAPANDSGRGRTDGTFVADCYLLRSIELISRIAAVLFHTSDAEEYQRTYAKLLAAYQSKYITQTGLLAPDTPTAYALAVNFNLLPSHLFPQAASRLVRALRLNDFRIPTGFVGTTHLLSALSSSGHTDVAYAMLLAPGFPSILYPVRMGATTIWERWDALLPDSRVNPGAMTSFNHYALGSVVSWLYEGIGGIKLIPPGDPRVFDGNGSNWQGMTFEVKPQIHHALEWAEAKYESRVGMIEVKWCIQGNEGDRRTVMVDVVVPTNAQAKVILSDHLTPEDEDGHVENVQWVGSGWYHFEYPYQQKGKWPVEPLLPPWSRASY